MNKISQNGFAVLGILAIVLITAIIGAGGWFLSSEKGLLPKEKEPAPNQDKSGQINSPTLTKAGSAEGQIGKTKIKIFLVALEDNGQTGKMIGCGDSIVSVDRGEKNTQEPIKTALEELFSIKEQFYGQSGLYNALAQSNLKVDQASLDNNKATVYLSGTYSLSGTCDNPRFEAQIKETVLQFASEVKVFLNNKPLEEVLSGKGG